MSDETYYTVLNIKETASAAEIRTAYLDLIKQVHPDTITGLAPYLRQLAEDKAKEITEAYGVLSSSSKRQDYDRQLAAYRRQSAPPAPRTPQAPPTPPPQQSSQCPICGRSDGGHSATCIKSRTSQVSTPSGAVNRPGPTTLRWLGYNWTPLIDWSCKHPLIVVLTVLFSSLFIASIFSGENTSQPESKTQSVTNNAAAASTGPYSKFPCDARYTISPIDGKPCIERHGQSVAAPPPGFVVDEKAALALPTISVSGTYTGTVHNQTVNLDSTFTVVLHQTEVGLLDGCVDIKPPLYGSGPLHGSISSAHLHFVVGDVTFRGDASKSGIAGSYVVARQEGDQLGDFRLSKQTASNAASVCTNGKVSTFEVVDAVRSPQQLDHTPSASQVLTPSAKLTARTPNAAVDSTVSSEIHIVPKQLDLSSLTFSERQSIESACSQAKYLQGPAAYDQCLVRQIRSWSAGPKQPDLSNMTPPERQSIESACSQAKYLEGPAAYDQCLVRQIQSWSAGPRRPDLSNLTSSERQSIESACSQAKFLEGPAAYNRCLVGQLRALANFRQ
jgi:hypothetical protein